MIIRRKVNRHFTTIPNEPITDEGLNFEALGLLTYLLSRPDNWRVCVEHLKGRGSIGRDKAYRLLVDLMHRGYVIRQQARDAESKQFGAYEYIVYDEPQKAEQEKPLPENPETAKTDKTEPLPEKPLPAEPYPANQDHNKYCKITNTLREHSASGEAGAEAPSASANAWKEALELLSTSDLPEPKKRSLIGKWLKQAPSDEGKEKFRAIVAAGRKAGTGDPIPYIEAAMDRAFPPPPDPKKFQAADWEPRVQSAISFGKWSPQWGPAPGKRGCLIPPEMISQQLVSALATGARR